MFVSYFLKKGGGYNSSEFTIFENRESTFVEENNDNYWTKNGESNLVEEKKHSEDFLTFFLD